MPFKILSTALASLFLVMALLFCFPPTPTHADELDDVTKQLNDLNSELNNSIAATKPLESQLTSMQKSIAGIKQEVVSIENNMVVKKKEIDKGYKSLGEKEKIMNQTIRDFYIQSYNNSPFLIFFSLKTASDMTQVMAYQQAKTAQDKAIITNIALSLVDLERKKTELQSQQKWLLATRVNLDQQSKKLDGVVKGAKDHQKTLSGKIAELNEKQQSIIAAKSGGDFTMSGNNELADEFAASIAGFRAAAPAGSFGIFSFGAYTHRNGMSQYGARARAEKGQSVEEILKAYYPNATLKKDYPVPGSISVDGVGSIPFEDQYMQGIYEVPGTWHVTALKAQAIAARTYAVRYTNNGQKSICTSEACQVFKNEKKGGNWEQAVNDTKGWVLVDGGGNPVSTQYASTHGGYSNTGGWDTTDGTGGSNFIDKAYEKLGGSPWLYKAWWRDGYSNTGATCGRSAQWLSATEMADIVNAAIALKTPGIDTSRITPATTSCWGGNPYSADELYRLVQDKGGISSANSSSVSLGNGSTNSVTINGITMSGAEFKTALNLRGPGYVRIPQTGFAFFNIEKK